VFTPYRGGKEKGIVEKRKGKYAEKICGRKTAIKGNNNGGENFKSHGQPLKL